MGFTADLGYECWFKPNLIETMMQHVCAARSDMNLALPGYGLSALQACRLEGGFIVAGWDCATEMEPNPDFERSPYELGLGWLVNLDAAPFVGRDALAAQKKNGYPFTLRSLVIDADNRPDDGTEIFANADGQGVPLGNVSCSIWSWGMEQTIGNASIRSEYADVKEAWVQIDGIAVKLALSRGPLVTLDRRIQVPAPINVKPV
jgi:aminomethyltransferase